jgi:hypothetical protein
MGRIRINKRSQKRVKKLDAATKEFLAQRPASPQEGYERELGPEDLLIVEPGKDTPIPMNIDEVNEAIVKALTAAGIDPSIIYAYHKTGFLVSEENLHLLSPEETEEWRGAIEEYEQKLEDER